jgi:hypothetical protein
MPPSKKTSAQDDQLLRKFLEEGAASYPDAVTTLIGYWREVGKRCKKVLIGRLPEYSKALGVPLTPHGVRFCDFPEPDTWTYSDVSVGAAIQGIPGPGKKPTFSWSSFCCLGWDRQDLREPSFGVWVGAWFPARMLAKLHKKLLSVGGEPGEFNTLKEWIWLAEDLRIEDAADFEGPLEQLLCRWINAWDSVGGINGFIR